MVEIPMLFLLIEITNQVYSCYFYDWEKATIMCSFILNLEFVLKHQSSPVQAGKQATDCQEI